MSVAVIADRVFWTDLHFKDVLFHRKDADTHNGREKITVDLNPLTAIIAVDMNSQPTGLYRTPCIISNNRPAFFTVPTATNVVVVFVGVLVINFQITKNYRFLNRWQLNFGY